MHEGGLQRPRGYESCCAYLSWLTGGWVSSAYCTSVCSEAQIQYWRQARTHWKWLLSWLPVTSIFTFVCISCVMKDLRFWRRTTNRQLEKKKKQILSGELLANLEQYILAKILLSLVSGRYFSLLWVSSRDLWYP